MKKEPIIYYISEAKPTGPVRFISFDVNGGKDFCYRSITSFSCFFFSKKRRNFKPKFKNYKDFDRLWHAMNLLEYDFFIKGYEKCGITDIPPEVKVKDLWDFYKLIGYDYKKQKWIEPNESVLIRE